jgi:two-component system catabolic regulation response regulator CreB/two-component system response regulator ChvI
MAAEVKEYEQDRKKKKILIVDDESDTTSSLSLSLEDSGLFEIDLFNDPLVALSNFRPNIYDLLLLDVSMPKMSGYDLYNEILKADNKVKVCFIGTHHIDYNALRTRFSSQEIDSFVTKPFLRKPIVVRKLIEKVETEVFT